MLSHVTRLLNENPEYYTIWNHRRRIIEKLLLELHNTADNRAHAEMGTKEMLQSDMQFLMPLLVKFPKCYWIWNHRHWLLMQVSKRLSFSAARSI